MPPTGDCRSPVRDSIVVFALSLVFLNVLEYYASGSTRDGLHYQGWSSDDMMQTLPASVLRDHPLRSLLYLHIEPPMLDLIRAAITQLYPDAAPDELLRRTDRGLYYVFSLLFAGMSTLVYVWIRKATGRGFALLCALIWTLHPAPMFYATMLESTMMGSLLVFWLFFELWLAASGKGSVVRIGFATSLMFFTRSFFQWFFFPFVVLSLILFRLPARKVGLFCAVLLLLTGPYLVWHYLAFGFFSTCTFNGYHYCEVFWYQPAPDEVKAAYSGWEGRYPADAKIFAEDNFNNEKTYLDYVGHSRVCARWILDHPTEALEGLGRSYELNSGLYWRPSATYTQNSLMDWLPWFSAYNTVFSGLSFVGLILLSLVSGALLGFLGDGRRLRSWSLMGFVPPLFYVFAITSLCNRLGWTDAIRMKFFLEPVFFVLIMSQAYATAEYLARKAIGRLGGGSLKLRLLGRIGAR